MEYSKIISVTGLPGLYELINSKGDGAIVRSLDDKTTKFVSGRVHNFSHLESIEVFTIRENVNLADVLNAMKDSKEKAPDGKDNDQVRKYFEKVYPDMDFERVYASDMKKMLKWFDVLNRNNIEIKLSEPEPEVEEEVVAEPTKKEVKKEAKREAKAEAKVEAKPAKAEKEKPAAKATEKKAEKKEKVEEKKPAAKKAAPKKEEKAAPKKAAKKAAPKKAAPKKKK